MPKPLYGIVQAPIEVPAPDVQPVAPQATAASA